MLNDMLLRLFVGAQSEVAAARTRLDEEQGAETVQVIMIMGIMAIIVVALFFSNIGLKQAILDLGTTVKDKLTDAKTL